MKCQDTLTGGIWNAKRSHMQSVLEWFKFQFELYEFQLKQFESHAIWMTLISVSVWTEIQVIQAEIRTIFKLEFESFKLEFEPFKLDLVFHTGAHALIQNPIVVALRMNTCLYLVFKWLNLLCFTLNLVCHLFIMVDAYSICLKSLPHRVV